MATDGDQDEFADLPDDFEGIDLDTIPALSTTSDTSESKPAPRSSTPSSQYSCDDNFDAAFLAAVDVLENQASDLAYTSPGIQNSRFFPKPPSRMFGGKAPCSKKTSYTSTCQTKVHEKACVMSSAKGDTSRKRSPSSPPPSSSVKKGKMQGEDVRVFLEGFDDEMTCPICCDFFVAAHLGNPCGHTFCGECGWQWISKNKITPICAICRTPLTKTAPIIPNFAVDSTVEKHIQVLGSNGSKDWQLGGKKATERNMRKERWKKIAAERNKPPKKVNAKRKGVWDYMRMEYDEFAGWLIPDDDVDDEDYEDVGEIRAPPTRRR